MGSRLPILGVLAWLVVSGVQADPVSDGLTAWRAGGYGGAQRLWQVAGEAGDAQAMFLLSELDSHGKGVPADLDKTVLWHKATAEAGHPPACYNLGDRYLNGSGVARDPALATDWLRRQPPEGYTVQVFASPGLAGVTRFLGDYRCFRQGAVYPFNKTGQNRQGMGYGQFVSRDDARAVLSGLPVMVQRGGPWVRQLKEVIGLPGDAEG